MKLKQILNEILIERKQVGILYHYTTESSIVSIGRNMTLYPGYGNDYISFSRNSFGITGWAGNTICRLVLNGDILSDDYKIKPIHYKLKSHLAEERIYATKVHIKNSLIAVEVLDTINDGWLDKIKEMYMNYNVNILKKWKSYK